MLPKTDNLALVRYLRLPRSLKEYLVNPRGTFINLSRWLNARWQLRKCDYVGPWTRVNGHIFVQNEGHIHIGERVLIFSHYAHSVLAALHGGTLEIGDRTFLNYGIDIAATKYVKIGSDCLIGTHVIILDNDFHDVVERLKIPEAKPVILEDRVWIGNSVTILPGVIIGEGSIVGAGSVVVNSIPRNSIAVGNPARIVKQL